MSKSDHPSKNTPQDGRLQFRVLGRCFNVSSVILASASLTGTLAVSSGCHLGQRSSGRVSQSQGFVTPMVSDPIISSVVRQEASNVDSIGHYQLSGPSEAELAAIEQLPPPQSPQDCVKGWDVLRSPHLRVLQTRAIQYNAPGTVGYAAGDFQVPGSQVQSFQFRDSQGPHAQTRLLLKQVADAYIDVHYNLERLQDGYAVLTIQEQTAQQAKQRKADGKAGRMDVLQAESAIGLTKSKMNPMQANLQSSIAQLESLTGASIAPAILKGIVSSQQLSMPNLDRRLPASVLRQRHDVRVAEQQVVSMGVRAGIPEVAMMPHLSLQGELTAKNDEGGEEAKNINDSLDFNLGGAETWSFSTEEFADSGGLSGGGYSPIPDTMRSFQSTVFSAAGEVERLLTQYHQALADVQSAERTKADASEAGRLALQQFQVDRIEGSYVAHAQILRAEAGQALAQARARLASIAVALLVATGGDCYPDLDSAAVYGE